MTYFFKGSNMDRDEALAYVNAQEPAFLATAKTKVGRKNTYICPMCNNGGGKSGTGIEENPKSKGHKRYKCHVCGLYEDVAGLFFISKGLDRNEPASWDELFKEFGLDVERGGRTQTSKPKPATPAPKPPQDEADAEPKTDYTEYFKACNARITKTSYHRGLSYDTLNHFKVGYDPAWRNPRGSKNAPTRPHLIIPLDRYSYTARAATAEHNEYSFRNVGTQPLFNPDAVTAKKNIFVVEGAIDAMSLYEVGGNVVGLGGTSGTSKFVEAMKRLPEQDRKAIYIIVALDNDKAGNRAADKLINGDERDANKPGLKDLGCNYVRVKDLYGSCKDANEALIKDRAALERQVNELMTLEGAYRRENSAKAYVQEFVNGISESVDTPPIPTGFERLDKEIFDGGLFEGLYFIGAGSSLGKTSFILQVADQIAAQGTDVLYISLEMSRFELMARSISRHTYINCAGHTDLAATTRGVTVGQKWSFYSAAKVENITKSISDYEKYSDHLYIKEGVGDIGVQAVKEWVKEHAALTGKPPVVIIDYLQILAPASERATDKQNVDKNVLELKRISRDFKIPIIGISSFNRDGYNKYVTMAAFKESGAVEYSSDVLMAIQFTDFPEKTDEAGVSKWMKAEKSKYPRTVEILVLKNRNGRVPEEGIVYDYDPRFNHFDEYDKEDEKDYRARLEAERANKEAAKKGGRYRA